MRLLPLAILVAALGFSACALDTGIDPTERVYPEADTTTAEADTTTGGDGDTEDPVQGDSGTTDPDAIGPDEAAPIPLRQGAWPATFTTTLEGGGLTLKPLGAQRGFTGTVSAPDGSLHLEALP